MMKNFLNINNWSSIKSDINDHSLFLVQRRNILFSRFCLASMLGAIAQALLDFLSGFPQVMGFDLVIAAFLLGGYLLNEGGHHKLAKIIMFSGMNILLFAFAAVVPRGVGIYVLFFPLVAFTFIVLDYKDRRWSYLLLFLSILLNMILVFTDYQPFGAINLQPTDPSFSFALNLIFAIVFIAIGIDFLLNLSQTAEKKLIENQVETEKLAEEVNKKNISLEKTNEELDRFVYSTSHDLRAPLASILGLINLTEMVKEPVPAEISKYLKLMKDRIENLDGFIQEIIDYSRNSRSDLVFEAVNIANLVEEVIKNNQFLENAPNIKFTTAIKVTDPVSIDSTRVSRILNNLVSNAIKYNDMSKDEPAVRIEAEITGENLKLTVHDTGKGIRDEIKDKIFDMFFRGTTDNSGSGLGLYITREMAQKMNGELSFRTNFGKGTKFILTLPIHQGDSNKT